MTLVQNQKKKKKLVLTAVMPQYRILVAMYVHVLTETNHAIRHPVLFCHCGGPHTAKKGICIGTPFSQTLAGVTRQNKYDTFVGTEPPAELQ